jgi:DNA-binding ferritin-like protein
MIEQLIGKVFVTRNLTHVAHLNTSSYAAHMALGDFYEAIIPAVDALAECWQGQFGKLGEITMESEKVDDIAEHLREEADWIEVNRNEIAGDSEHLSNLVDSLTALYTSVIYKLERFN